MPRLSKKPKRKIVPKVHNPEPLYSPDMDLQDTLWMEPVYTHPMQPDTPPWMEPDDTIVLEPGYIHSPVFSDTHEHSDTPKRPNRRKPGYTHSPVFSDTPAHSDSPKLLKRSYNMETPISQHDLEIMRGMEGYEEIGPYSMEAGLYVIGDLCDILSEKHCEELEGMGVGYQTDYGRQGKFRLSGERDVVIFDLPDGEGIYQDENANEYMSMSGTIGMTLASGLDETFDGSDGKSRSLVERLFGNGHIIDYKEDFSCVSLVIRHPEGYGDIAYIGFGASVRIPTQDQLFSVGGVSRNANREREYRKYQKNQRCSFPIQDQLFSMGGVSRNANREREYRK